MNQKKDCPALHAPGSGKYCPVVNLFRHKLTPDLLCAVPEDEPVPSFLDGGSWSFAGAVPTESLAGIDQDGRSAPAGVPAGRWRMVRARPDGEQTAEAGAVPTCPPLKTVLSRSLATTEIRPEPSIGCPA
jgi:hypothetical protein